MKEWKKACALPEAVLQALADPGCGKYVSFSDGRTFFCPSLTSPDGQILALALREEHTDMGRALVDALWFDHPACVTLVSGEERLGLEMDVYRCHIAGPLFLKKLLEVRAVNPEQDMASAWELRIQKETEAKDISQAKWPERAAEPEWHLDHPKLHEK